MHHSRITAGRAVMMGKPCVKETRITVELILRKLGAGRSFSDLLEAYPQLTEDDLRAALAFVADYFVADYMEHEAILPALRPMRLLVEEEEGALCGATAGRKGQRRPEAR